MTAWSHNVLPGNPDVSAVVVPDPHPADPINDLLGNDVVVEAVATPAPVVEEVVAEEPAEEAVEEVTTKKSGK